MAGIDFKKLDILWQNLSVKMVEGAGHTATFYYHKELITAGEGVDSFMGENLDGRDPSVNLTYSGQAPYLVSGQYFAGSAGSRTVREKETVERLPMGFFQPGDMIFKCQQVHLPESRLRNVKHVELSGFPGKTFRYDGSHPIFMLDPSFTYIILRGSNIAGSD